MAKRKAQDTNAEEWLTVREAAQMASYHEEHVRRIVRNGDVEGKRVVTVWLVKRSSLLAYLERQAAQGERRGRPKGI